MREIKRKNLEDSHHGRQWSRLFYVCRGIIRMLDRAIPSYRSAIKVVAKYLRLSMEEEREGREGERGRREKERERFQTYEQLFSPDTRASKKCQRKDQSRKSVFTSDPCTIML